MTDVETQVRALRASGLNAYAISCLLDLTLTQVRRAEDAHAREVHARWSAAREAGDEAERVFGAQGD